MSELDHTPTGQSELPNTTFSFQARTPEFPQWKRHPFRERPHATRDQAEASLAEVHAELPPGSQVRLVETAAQVVEGSELGEFVPAEPPAE